MAIVQISRIQHRRGVNSDLPQLASAELGWSVDTRQLYIGNGTIEEGAPTIGNTEILTEYSDLLSIAQAYTFKGELAGYTVQTGTSVSQPVLRSLQDKLDDFVNIRDFGAVGDGVTDDTAAINRALYEIYCRDSSQPLVRRTIYFPGGRYMVSGDVVKVPTYARLQGDGADRTFIIQNDATQDCALKLADTKQQIDAAIGTNGATPPQMIDVRDMTIQHTGSNYNTKTVSINKAKNVIFNGVKFSGAVADLSTSGNSSACVGLFSNAALSTTNVYFNNCEFSDQTYAVTASDAGINNVVFNGSKFDNLYLGLKLGEGSLTPPYGIRVVNSAFDGIYSSAINSYASTNIISAFNYYGDVANSRLGNGFENGPVLVMQAADCYSFGDVFTRDNAVEETYPRVSSANAAVISVVPHESIRYGVRRLGPGTVDTLADGATGNTSITISSTGPGATINYSIVRGSTVRTGFMKVSHDYVTGAVVYDEEYTDTGNVQVTLTPTVGIDSTIVTYTTVATGGEATLRYSIDWHKI